MTYEQELMSGVAKTVFRLNGQLFILGEALASQAGLTGAWWQVLGAILRQPLSVADIAREIGVTRQSVQRVADLLVAEGRAEFRPNPAHARSKLLAPTTKGRDAVRRIAPAHAALADRLAVELGVDQLRDSLAKLERLSVALGSLIGAADPRDELPERWVVASQKD
jgi:DNA-binding MarR family transcriptional regulator